MNDFEFNNEIAKTLSRCYTKKGNNYQIRLNSNICLFRVFIQQLEMLNKVIKLESQNQVLIKYISLTSNHLSDFGNYDFIKILICTNFKIEGIIHGLWNIKDRLFFDYDKLYQVDKKNYEDYAYGYWIRIDVLKNGFLSLNNDYKSFQLFNKLHAYYKEGQKIDKVIKSSINFLNLKLKQI